MRILSVVSGQPHIPLPRLRGTSHWSLPLLICLALYACAEESSQEKVRPGAAMDAEGTLHARHCARL